MLVYILLLYPVSLSGVRGFSLVGILCIARTTSLTDEGGLSSFLSITSFFYFACLTALAKKVLYGAEDGRVDPLVLLTLVKESVG